MSKRFKLAPEQIRRLIPSLGGCIATDSITVEGRPAQYMSRSAPHNSQDSGWLITAGESEAELKPEDVSVYDLNTIANYDHAIIRFLTYPVGTQVVMGENQSLVAVGNPAPPNVILLPGVEAGPTSFTANWSAKAQGTLLRRVEDDQLVLWRPNLTFWVSALSGRADTPAANLAHHTASMSPNAFDVRRWQQHGTHSALYRVNESEGGHVQASAQAIHCHADRVLIAAAYFDDQAAETEALSFLTSITAVA